MCNILVKGAKRQNAAHIIHIIFVNYVQLLLLHKFYHLSSYFLAKSANFPKGIVNRTRPLTSSLGT